MAENAGFAFVGCISQDLANSGLRASVASMVPPYTFTLPSSVFVTPAAIGISGSLAVLAPQVQLETRADDQVTATFSFAGAITFTEGSAQQQEAVVILATTLTLGLFASVALVGTDRQVSVGLSLATATVEAIEIAVLTGPSLAPRYSDALNSADVLTALSEGLRKIPPDLVTFAPSSLTIPATVNETYQPPGRPIFRPDTLFSFQVAIARVVVRPLGPGGGQPGALVVAVDIASPVASSGDPSALIDLTRAGASPGYAIDYTGGTPRFGGTTADGQNSVITLNGGWLIALVNEVISPQLAAKSPATLANNQLALTDTQDCVQLSIDTFTASLDSAYPIPTSIVLTGLTLVIKATRFVESHLDPNGYFVGDKAVGNVEATVTANIIPALHAYPEPARELPTGDAIASNSVSFWSDPRGGYLFVDDVLLNEFPESRQLSSGTHTVMADATTFQSWETFGSVSVDSTSAPTAKLTVAGSGGLLLHLNAYDPFVTQDTWNIDVVGTDISLAGWVTALAIIGGPLYFVATIVAGLFKANIWIPAIIESANSPLPPKLTKAANALVPVPLYFQRVVQLPNILLPWMLEIQDLVVTPSGIDAYGVVSPYGSYTPNLQIVAANETAAFGNRVFIYTPSVTTIGSDGGQVTWDVHSVSPILVLLTVPTGLYNVNDPSLFVTWTVTRNDTDVELISRQLGAQAEDSFGGAVYVILDHASAALQACEAFTVSCQLASRQADGSASSIFDSTFTINIADHFDRHHPFVQWGPKVKYIYPGEPYWSAIPNRSHVPGKRWVKQVPMSRIHRTDVWSGGKRCLVADTPGLMGNPPRARGGKVALPDKVQAPRTLSYPWTYLDTLPLSLDDVRQDRERARGILCDYCFFGGPTRTSLRGDFPV